MPVAEEAGLILEIDEWMLRQVCGYAARWYRADNPDLWGLPLEAEEVTAQMASGAWS